MPAASPRTAFWPAPEVDSAVLRIERIGRDLAQKLDGLSEGGFFTVVRAGFAEKRKQVHNSLARQLDLSHEEAVGVLEHAAVELVTPGRNPGDCRVGTRGKGLCQPLTTPRSAKPLLVLVPGLGARGDTYRLALKPLREHFDVRVAGVSPDFPPRLGWGFFESAIESAAGGVGTFQLLGHSLGGSGRPALRRGTPGTR
ncbi:MAG: rRNA adenine N-6-methyltransferase family protein [Hymenobacter sp.]